ncbi:hypothetical protein QD357_29855, partial [Rhizobium sp. BR 317]|uniref:hypothetical protein n=1 Tax=Rhizobium sp. BR 317 TaxID=3040015 RepID=UPI0039BFC3A6
LVLVIRETHQDQDRWNGAGAAARELVVRLGLHAPLDVVAGYLALNDRSASILIEHLREAVRTRIRPGDGFDYFGYKAPLQ